MEAPSNPRPARTQISRHSSPSSIPPVAEALDAAHRLWPLRESARARRAPTLPGSLHPGIFGRARNGSCGAVCPGLLRHHVGGVPGGPVFLLARPVENVRPPGVLLMLLVGGLGPPKRALQVCRGRECRVG